MNTSIPPSSKNTSLFRALIIDDERLARRDLAAQLEECPAVELVGEAADLSRAIALVDQLSPDLIFLDIQLGDGSGFDLLPHLPVTVRTIFVTAYDHYAIRAFEVNAVDYLLKPVNLVRLHEAIERLNAPPPSPPALTSDDRLYVPVGNQSGFIDVKTIRRVSATGNYTIAHTTDGRHFTIKQSLHEWERRLPSEIFLRVSRSEMIQIALIERIMPGIDHHYEIKIKDDPVPVIATRRVFFELKERIAHL